jgi:hypothetical protein
MMELTEDFVKLMEIAIVVVGTLSVFFTYLEYNITVTQDAAGRESVILGNYILDNKCLTYEGAKGLFDSSKFDSVSASCFNYPYGSFTIELWDESEEWGFVIASSDAGGEAAFTVAVRMSDGEVKPATLEVKV